MDCRQFRRDHLDYLDDTLPGDVMRAAQLHVLQCGACAAHDALVRRSLMVVRSLPDVAPRLGFEDRMAARLATCARLPDPLLVDAALNRVPWSGAPRRGWWRPASQLAALMGVVAGGWWWQAGAPGAGRLTTALTPSTVSAAAPVGERVADSMAGRVAARRLGGVAARLSSRVPARFPVSPPLAAWPAPEAVLWYAPMEAGRLLPAVSQPPGRAAMRRPVAVADDVPVSFLPAGARTAW
ncbi:MAG: hypothetical protein KJT01_02140 [Gemmatimonadetes bacterium]|nr:hypothetical protein [Gemmatimonadota bacterium]